MSVDSILYDRLGLSQAATLDDIKKGYRKLAVQWHPDKNPGVAEAKVKFQEIAEAYEILSDPDKRKRYDQVGWSAYKNSGIGTGGSGTTSGMANMADNLFRTFFGMATGMGNGMGNAVKKTPDILREIYIPLQDFALGRTIGLQLLTDMLCTDCKGSGCANGKSIQTCGVCNGTKIVFQQINAVFRIPAVCQGCMGKGTIVSPGDECKTCMGYKVTKQARKLRVDIRPGMLPGTRIEFLEHANEFPDHETGKFIVLLQDADPTNPRHMAMAKEQTLRAEDEKESEQIKQARADFVELQGMLDQKPLQRESPSSYNLELVKPITLEECILGAHFSVVLLDGQVISVKTPEHSIIHPETDKIILPHLGLPETERERMRGDLIIKFELQLPAGGGISKDSKSRRLFRKALKQVLGPSYTPISKRVDGAIECQGKWVRQADQFLKT